MRQSKKASKITRTIKDCLLIGALISSTVGILSAQQGIPPGAKFEIVSVRILTATEAAERSPDFIGPNVAVRVRLSCSGSGFYYYTWGNDVAPHGYSVKLTEGEILWRNRMPGQVEQHSSPGIEKLNAFVPGVWRLMSGHVRPAIEWEELDSTSFSGEKHAFTAFIKINEKDKPIEIISDSYVVPAGAAPAK